MLPLFNYFILTGLEQDTSFFLFFSEEEFGLGFFLRFHLYERPSLVSLSPYKRDLYIDKAWALRISLSLY